MGMLEDCRALTDDELMKSARFLAMHEKKSSARLIAHLVEIERRKIPRDGGRSPFEYCVKELGFEEFDAYRRVKAARFAARYPIALDFLGDGKVCLSALAHLEQGVPKTEDGRAWLKRVEGLSRREVEALIVTSFPEEARPDFIRRLPVTATLVSAAPPYTAQATPSAPPLTPGPVVEWAAMPAGEAMAGRVWQDVMPVAADRVRIGFDAASSLMRMIERAKQLLRHKYPEGHLEDVLKDVLETFLDKKDPQRRLSLKTPPMPRDALLEADDKDDGRLPTRFVRAYAAGRYIPAKVKSAVWARDQGRCAWRFEDGTVCGGRDFVEFDHIVPFAKGGRSECRNIRLLCRAHNQLAAEMAFPAPPNAEPPGPGLPATA